MCFCCLLKCCWKELTSIRLAAVVLFTVLLLINTLTVFFSNFGFEYVALNELVESQDSLLVNSIETFVSGYLADGETLLEMLSDNIVADKMGYDYNFDLTNMDYVTKSLLPIQLGVLKQTLKLGNLFVGYADRLGNHWSVFKDWTSPFVSRNYELATCNSNVSEWARTGLKQMMIFDILDGTKFPLELNKTEPMTPSTTYDPRNHSWYHASDASAKGEIKWGEVLTIINILTYTASMKVYTKNTEEYIGISTIWYQFPSISEYLKEEIDFGDEDFVSFVLNTKTKRFLGSNVEDKYLKYLDEETSKQKLFLPEESPHKVINNATKYVMEKTNDFENMDGVESRSTMYIGSTLYLVYVKTITISDLSLVSISAVPYNNFYGNIFWGALVVFFVSLASVNIVTFCGICLGCCVMRPLQTISKEMKLVRTMKLDKIQKNRKWKCFSLFSEIRSIQSSFYFTVNKLAEYRSFLPEELLEAENKTFGKKGKDAGLLIHDSSESSSLKFGSEAGIGEKFGGSKLSDDESSTSNTSVAANASEIVYAADKERKHGGLMMKTMFDLGLNSSRKTMMLFVRIFSSKTSWNFNPGEYTHFYEKMFIEIRRYCALKKNTLSVKVFEETGFIITSNIPSRLFAAGIHLVNIFNDYNERRMNKSVLKNMRFGYKSIVCAGDIWYGNLGCQKVKKKVFFGDVLEEASDVLKYLQRKWPSRAICCTSLPVDYIRGMRSNLREINVVFTPLDLVMVKPYDFVSDSLLIRSNSINSQSFVITPRTSSNNISGGKSNLGEKRNGDDIDSTDDEDDNDVDDGSDVVVYKEEIKREELADDDGNEKNQLLEKEEEEEGEQDEEEEMDTKLKPKVESERIDCETEEPISSTRSDISDGRFREEIKELNLLLLSTPPKARDEEWMYVYQESEDNKQLEEVTETFDSLRQNFQNVYNEEEEDQSYKNMYDKSMTRLLDWLEKYRLNVQNEHEKKFFVTNVGFLCEMYKKGGLEFRDIRRTNIDWFSSCPWARGCVSVIDRKPNCFL